MYTPKPIDTSAVVLPPEIEQLVETLAESTHDNWAAQRISDAWVLGEERDDNLKTHPNLVPYNQLSEADKDYDRRTAMETIKSLYALGFCINK